MMELGFALPWALAALTALPALWWLLKALPPPPQRQVFPALRLLMGLSSERDTPHHMPLWLLILRMALLAALIIAAAGPVINPDADPAQTTGPLLLAVDDGWASASDWDQRKHWLENRVTAATRQGRTLYLVPTAPPIADPLEPMTAQQALNKIQGWQPHPWSTDHAAVLAALKALGTPEGLETQWLSDGLGDADTSAFIQGLARLGNGPSITVGQTGQALRQLEETDDGSSLNFEILSLHPRESGILALDKTGHELARVTPEHNKAMLTLPLSLRNQIDRVVIEGERSAAATDLLDENARRRTIGVIGNGDTDNHQSLRDSLTYVEKAIIPFAQIIQGDVTDLIQQKPSLIVTDGLLAEEDVPTLQNWIEAGGMMVRFASDALIQSTGEPLLPTRLRGGGRALGGVLSWTTPQPLAAFPSDGPFFGLTIPPDSVVRSQVLADLDPLLIGSEAKSVKVWAKLTDGTPLVTAKAMGKGWLILFHCGATPQWSSVSLSGLFPDMLHRLVQMAQSAGAITNGPLKPYKIMDGFGTLRPPSSDVTALTPQSLPGPNHPPGFYGTEQALTAFNLGPFIAPMHPLETPPSIRVSGLNDRPSERDLRPFFLLMGILLGLADLVLTSRLVRGAALVMILGLGAAQSDPTWEHGLQTRLAYVITGDGVVDRLSEAGLKNLTRVLGQRSTADLGEPKGIRLDDPDLAFYPLIYWPLTAPGVMPTPEGALTLKTYLKRGGLIVFDRLDGAQPDEALSGTMRRLNRLLDLPPLQIMAQDHVLTRSFYLLHAPNGQLGGAPVWVQTDNPDNDGVSSIILTSDNWAALWAGRGNATQQESAFRFGINLCLYALTGNYKADQVHLPAIMERLGTPPQETRPLETPP